MLLPLSVISVVSLQIVVTQVLFSDGSASFCTAGRRMLVLHDRHLFTARIKSKPGRGIPWALSATLVSRRWHLVSACRSDGRVERRPGTAGRTTRLEKVFRLSDVGRQGIPVGAFSVSRVPGLESCVARGLDGRPDGRQDLMEADSRRTSNVAFEKHDTSAGKRLLEGGNDILFGPGQLFQSHQEMKTHCHDITPLNGLEYLIRVRAWLDFPVITHGL